MVEEAYAGDIIGVFDPSIFLNQRYRMRPGQTFCFEGIPTFAPSILPSPSGADTMKAVHQGHQSDRTGKVQFRFFRSLIRGMEEIIVGVVGVLQFDVLKYRLENDI